MVVRILGFRPRCIGSDVLKLFVEKALGVGRMVEILHCDMGEKWA